MLAIAKKPSPDHHDINRHAASHEALKISHAINSNPQVPIIQCKPICPCDGGCPRCTGVIQPKLKIGQPDDIYEQEADRVAEQVMHMPEPVIQPKPTLASHIPPCEDEELIQSNPISEQIHPLVHRLPEEEENEKIPQTNEVSGMTLEITPEVKSKMNTLKAGGRPLSEAERSFFEPRFGYDLSRIRIHTDDAAADLARSVNARAFTRGRDVVFGAGEYASQNKVGRRLLAHELVHTIHQCPGITLMRQVLSVPPVTDTALNFCKPYSTDVEARVWHRIMTTFFIPVITSGVTPEINLLTKLAPPEFAGLLQRLGKGFGNEVGGLWATYLNPGANRTRRVFSSPSSEIVEGFVNSVTTNERQTKLVDEIKNRLRRRCPRVTPNAWTNNAVDRFLPKRAREYPINFDRPFEIPGNIAGGVGSSDFGADMRKVEGTVGFFRTVDAAGNTTGVQMRTNFQFVVRDAIDFCPGDPGAGLEQNLTIPLSRLESSGLAYDVPFEVRYQGAPVDISLDLSLVSRCWRRRRTRHRRRKD